MALRVAVVGHVEHVTIGRAAAVPQAGDILHLDETCWIAGGGGGVAFHQLVRGPGEVHLFTAIGNDDAGAAVLARIEGTGASVHVARRAEPHTRDVVIVTPDGERTIVVVGQPLQPRRDDPLPWDLLASCDAVYFTAQDPQALRAARSARLLVVTARRSDALTRARVVADIVIGSARDPRESRGFTEYALPPRALILTEGADGGRIETAAGATRFVAPAAASGAPGAYGAGDTFAAALTWYAACGAPLAEACRRAAEHASAALRDIDPLVGQMALAEVAGGGDA